MELMDYGDGVRHHYCIARRQISGSGGIVWQFWNQTTLGWESAGTVYVGVEKALKKLCTLYREQARRP